MCSEDHRSEVCRAGGLSPALGVMGSIVGHYTQSLEILSLTIIRYPIFETFLLKLMSLTVDQSECFFSSPFSHSFYTYAYIYTSMNILFLQSDFFCVCSALFKRREHIFSGSLSRIGPDNQPKGRQIRSACEI